MNKIVVVCYKMALKTKDLCIIKVPLEFKEITKPTLNFEMFEDLFLSDIENKRKIKLRKRGEEFNYKLFHEKLAKRNELQKSTDEITVLKSPLKSVKSVKSVKSNTRSNTASSTSSKCVSEFDPRTHEKPNSTLSPLIPSNLYSFPTSPISANSTNSITSPSSPSSPKSITSLNFRGLQINNEENRDILKFIKDQSNLKERSCILNSVKSSEDEDSFENMVKNFNIPEIKIKTPKNNEIKTQPSENIETPSMQSYFSEIIDNNNNNNNINDNKNNKNMNDMNDEKENFLKTIGGVDISFKSSILSSVSDKTKSVFKIRSKQNPLLNSFKSSIIKSKNSHTSIKSNDSFSEQDEKRELLFKFQFIATKHPNLAAKYPFNMRSDLKVMRSTYNMIIKQISLNSKVDKFNTYLISGFMLFEHLFGKLGFDMEGFSKHQIESMKSYEELLIELGEKEYIPYGMDKWSVEMRLIMTVMFNAFWFIVAKSISKKTNFNLIGMFSSFLGGNKNSNIKETDDVKYQLNKLREEYNIKKNIEHNNENKVINENKVNTGNVQYIINKNIQLVNEDQEDQEDQEDREDQNPNSSIDISLPNSARVLRPSAP